MYFMCFHLYCAGDLVTRMGDWEIQVVFGKLPDNPGELALMFICLISYCMVHGLAAVCSMPSYLLTTQLQMSVITQD